MVRMWQAVGLQQMLEVSQAAGVRSVEVSASAASELGRVKCHSARLAWRLTSGATGATNDSVVPDAVLWGHQVPS